MPIADWTGSYDDKRLTTGKCFSVEILEHGRVKTCVFELVAEKTSVKIGDGGITSNETSL